MKSLTETFLNVSDSIAVNRFENGWMIEFSGNDQGDRWVTRKIVASDLKEVLTLLEEYSKITLS